MPCIKACNHSAATAVAAAMVAHIIAIAAFQPYKEIITKSNRQNNHTFDYSACIEKCIETSHTQHNSEFCVQIFVHCIDCYM